MMVILFLAVNVNLWVFILCVNMWQNQSRRRNDVQFFFYIATRAISSHEMDIS
jgi:hypothetical protein